jgi:hypothetical protein
MSDSWVIDTEEIVENFAGLHEDEDRRRHFAAQLDPQRLVNEVVNNPALIEAFDNAVLETMYLFGYTDPDEDE